MEPRYARSLVAQLTQRGDITLSSPMELSTNLGEKSIPPKFFYQTFTIEPDFIDDCGRYQKFESGLLFRNENASSYIPGQRVLEALLDKFDAGDHSLVRAIRSDGRLIDMMKNAQDPYSLILIQSVRNEELPKAVKVEKPILIIPQVTQKQLEYIQYWEDMMKN